MAPVQLGESKCDHVVSLGSHGVQQSFLESNPRATLEPPESRDIVATITIRDVPESVRDSLLLRARVRGQTLEQFLREFLISSFSKERALQSIDFRRARLPRVNVQDLLHRDDEGRYE